MSGWGSILSASSMGGASTVGVSPTPGVDLVEHGYDAPDFDLVLTGEWEIPVKQKRPIQFETVSLSTMLDDPRGLNSESGGVLPFDEVIHPRAEDGELSRKSGIFSLIIVSLFVIGAMGGGIYLMVEGLSEKIDANMPLPSHQFQNESVDTKDVVLGDDLFSTEFEVYNADSDGGSNSWDEVTNEYLIDTMSIKRMAPGSVFIPDDGIYSEIRASDSFKESNYSDFYSLAIPANVHRSTWYSAGGPLTASDLSVLTGARPLPAILDTPQSDMNQSGDQPQSQAVVTKEDIEKAQDQGKTLLASHISWGRARGAFYALSDVSHDTLVWVKGFDGSLSTWRISSLWYTDHTDFPVDYLSPSGERELILTTCGGSLNEQGYYAQNVFAVAKPVPLTLAISQQGH